MKIERTVAMSYHVQELDVHTTSMAERKYTYEKYNFSHSLIVIKGYEKNYSQGSYER